MYTTVVLYIDKPTCTHTHTRTCTMYTYIHHTYMYTTVVLYIDKPTCTHTHTHVHVQCIHTYIIRTCTRL